MCVSALIASLPRLLARSRRLRHLLAAVPGSRASAGSARTTDAWRHLHCQHVGAVCCGLGLLPCSPGVQAGGTLQPTMKSWQLIAVVGDALQVRREKTAPNAARERRRARAGAGEEAASAEALRSPLARGRGWQRHGDRGRAAGGRSVQTDIFGCLWQRSRCPTFARRGWRRVRLRGRRWQRGCAAHGLREKRSRRARLRLRPLRVRLGRYGGSRSAEAGPGRTRGAAGRLEGRGRWESILGSFWTKVSGELHRPCSLAPLNFICRDE